MVKMCVLFARFILKDAQFVMKSKIVIYLIIHRHEIKKCHIHIKGILYIVKYIGGGGGGMGMPAITMTGH